MSERARIGAMAAMSVREFQAAGLLWLVNRTLHPFGVALSCAVDVATGDVNEKIGLQPVCLLDDPEGILFSYEDEILMRAAFYEWLASRYKTGKPRDPIREEEEA